VGNAPLALNNVLEDEMQAYQSHKIVEAGKILEVGTNDKQGALIVLLDGSEFEVDQSDYERIKKMSEAHSGLGDGYLVIYADGYVSWSPAKAFETGYHVVQPSSGKSNIEGYRQLNEGEVAAINDVKRLGVMLGEFIDVQRADDQCDQRWVSLGATHFQQGLMALTRAIAKPDFF
jgi:hypothetical protein